MIHWVTSTEQYHFGLSQNLETHTRAVHVVQGVDSAQQPSCCVGSGIDTSIIARTRSQSLGRTTKIEFGGGKGWEIKHTIATAVTFHCHFIYFAGV